MAIVYGACTGTSGSKYNVWLDVTTNSQNTGSNLSNVTVMLKLSRNDGYAQSAYNLYANQNTASLSVGGTSVYSSSLTVDTRNGATAQLASWTGDVSHNSDGTLALSVEGAFTMGNTGLSGGSVLGSFTLPAIPRESSVSLSVSTVNPGDSVTATVTAASGTFSHRLVYSVGSFSQTQNLAAGTLTDTFTVPASWASAVTSGSSGTISVAFSTISGGAVIGTSYKSITFSMPDTQTYRPDFTPVITRSDNGVPSSWGVYVEGKSGVTVNITNASYKNGASFSSASVTVGALRQNTLPAVFPVINAYGTVNIVITVTDSRGLSCTKTESITVYPYKAPSVSINSIKRCLQDGTLSDSGTYACATVNFSSYTCGGNNASSCVLTYGNNEVEIPTSYTPVVFGDGNLLGTSSYFFTVTVTDEFASSHATRRMSTAGVALNIRPGGRGLGIGKYCDSNDLVQSRWDVYTEGSFYENNARLVNYSATGRYVTFRGEGGYTDGRKKLTGDELTFSQGFGGYYKDVSVSLVSAVFGSYCQIASVLCSAESADNHITASLVSGSGQTAVLRCYSPVAPVTTGDIYVDIVIFFNINTQGG